MLYMEYDDAIAKKIGQDKIVHEILYKVNQSDFAIFQIVGEHGSGKKTLCDKFAELWQQQTQGIVIKLMSSLQSIPDDYSIFKNFLIQESAKTKRFINVFQEILKDIPHIGNSFSAIIKEIVSFQYDKEKMDGTLSENEQYIISTIKKLSYKRKLLLICSELDEWDLKSKKLILSLMNHKVLLGEYATYYIVTTKTTESLEFTNAYKNILQKIGNDDIPEIVQSFNPRLQLGRTEIEEFGDLTNGNLELIKELANMYSIPQSFLYTNYVQIVEEYLKNHSTNAEELMQLLKEIAFIGYTVDIRLIKLFSQISTKPLDDILAEAIELSYLNKDKDLISFVKQYVYTILEKNKYKDVHYYLNLCKCINRLYPTRYDLQMRYMWYGNLKHDAEKFCLLYLIKYYRENNVYYPLSSNKEFELKKNSNYSFYTELCAAYKLYKCKDYSGAEQILLNTFIDSPEFCFEKDYLLSLIATNKYYSEGEFDERIDVMNRYISDDFEKDYPEMYLRALMILAELYSEVSNQEMCRKCIRKTGEIFSKYSLTDRLIRRYEYCFKMKANAFYKIEIATKYTQTAYEYFKNPENMQYNISDYYLAILNHAANLIVLSKNTDAKKMLYEACHIIQANIFLEHIHKDILINNLLINEYYVGNCSVDECISSYEKLINCNLGCADNLLVRNNQAAFVALNNNFSHALQLSKDLYMQIQYNEDADDYYRYYILNNYCILLWLNGKTEEAIAIWNVAKLLVPWPKDQTYLKARIDHITEMFANTSPSELLKEPNWNRYLFLKNSNVVGEAWKFWSNLLLLSELQIWSDY